MACIPTQVVQSKDGARLRIRSAEPRDAAALMAYLEHVNQTSEFSVVLPGESKMTVEKWETELAEVLEAAGGYFALCEYDGLTGAAIVGELSFHAHPRQRMQHHGHLGMSIHAEWRNRGLGQVMLRHLLDWAREHPTVEKVCLGVLAENAPAIALYKKMGFVEECRRNREFKFAPGRYIDDIQMSRWVKMPDDGRSV